MANKFLRGAASSDESDSDEEDKTVVLSAKDKRFVEMDQAIKMIQDKSKVHDWVVASSGTSFLFIPHAEVWRSMRLLRNEAA